MCKPSPEKSSPVKGIALSILGSLLLWLVIATVYAVAVDYSGTGIK